MKAQPRRARPQPQAPRRPAPAPAERGRVAMAPRVPIRRSACGSAGRRALSVFLPRYAGRAEATRDAAAIATAAMRQEDTCEEPNRARASATPVAPTPNVQIASIQPDCPVKRCAAQAPVMIAASAPSARRAKPQSAANVTRRLSRGRSKPHERLRETAPETVPAQFALHGDEADAFLARFDVRPCCTVSSPRSKSPGPKRPPA